MKKLLLLLTAVALGTSGTQAAKMDNALAGIDGRPYGNSFIFVENGVTFSVYPDGEFDFYMDNRVNVGIGAQIGNVGITFNSGYNYNPYVQYDDYGAVIQVENIPIYYDYYGRVTQIGSVDIRYNNGMVRRIGGLSVYYNGTVFSHYTGFVNIYNRHYVYRPFHRYFVRPAIVHRIVYTTPYRRYYRPVRYTYYAPYRDNHRKAYVKVGHQYRNNNTVRRANVYRNDNRVTVRENDRMGRSMANRSGRVADDSRTPNNGRTIGRVPSNTSREATARRSAPAVNRQATPRSEATRTTPGRSQRTAVNRSGNSRTVTKKEVVRTPTERTVTQRRVSATPQGRTVEKRTTTYKRPEARSSSKSPAVGRQSNSRGTVKRSAPAVRKSSSTPAQRSSGARTAASRSSRGN